MKMRLTLDDLEDHDAGSKASINETFGKFSGRLPASTPAAATAVLSRPMMWTWVGVLWILISEHEVVVRRVSCVATSLHSVGARVTSGV